MSKVAVITGASRGIGAAIAEKLANDGMRVVINYRKNETLASELRDLINAKSKTLEQATVFQADVSQYEQARELMNFTAKFFGGVDVVINNAGMSTGGLLFSKSPEDWWQVVCQNLGAAMNTTKAALPFLLQKSCGHIVNIGSVSGVRGSAGNSDYAAAKAGLLGFSKSLALELMKYNIMVNTVSPGFIDTDMVQNMPEKQRLLKLQQIPQKRMGKPSEVAELVALLVSGKVDYLVGQNLIVDGGLSI